MKEYDLKYQLYFIQKTLLSGAKTFIQATISDANWSLLGPRESVWQWVKRLADSLRPGKGYLRRLAETKYRQTKAASPSTDINTWLGQWEQAMSDGIKYEIAEVQSNFWLGDLAERIAPLSGSHASDFRRQAEQKVAPPAFRLQQDRGRAAPVPTYNWDWPASSRPGSRGQAELLQHRQAEEVRVADGADTSCLEVEAADGADRSC